MLCVGMLCIGCIALGVLYFALCHRCKKQVTAERVEDEDTIIQKEEGYDMTTMGKNIETETMV
jgi:hypothetical protein